MLILILPLATLTSAYASVTNPYMPLPNPVYHSMTVRVSFLGISDINRSQLAWNLEPTIKPNIQSNNNPQGLSNLVYGSSYSMKYDLNFVSAAATSNLKTYLKSIAKVGPVPEYLQGSQPDRNSYMTLDALKSEEWLNSHISDFGGIPQDGYLLVLADLSDISNLHHYYSVQYNDLDTASSRATSSKNPLVFPVVNWMFSWGGHYRFYFIDLSGGDPDYDYSQTGHVPIQDFDFRTLSQRQVTFSRNVATVTEYVADYISEATRNLFLPDYAYTPTYATAYRLAINIFDETGKLSSGSIGDYLSESLVKKAFQHLVPAATWNVSVTTRQLRDDSGLAKVVSDSLVFSDDVRGVAGGSYHIDYHDYRKVYSYLQSHLGQYVDTSGDTVVLPMFEFVFKGGGRFADTKEDNLDQFAGISVGDLAMIGTNDRNLFTLGFELTKDTIHELGHSMGLMHPHSFGYTEDYVASVMAYGPYEYDFSQFDVDAVQRAYSDFLVSQNGAQLQTTTLTTTEAAPPNQGLVPSSLSIWIALAVGVAVGFVLAFLLIRRRNTAR